MTTGRDPTAPGGTPRSPRSSGRDSRRRKRPGESGEEIADIGAICRTEAILNALAARRAREREPAAGQSGAAGKPVSEAPGVPERGVGDSCAGGPGAGRPRVAEAHEGDSGTGGVSGCGAGSPGARDRGMPEPAKGESGAAASAPEATVAKGAKKPGETGDTGEKKETAETAGTAGIVVPEVSGGVMPEGGVPGGVMPGGAVGGSGVSGGDPALAVLAALASDVDEHAEPPCLHDPWQDDAFLCQIRAVCGDSGVQGKAGLTCGTMLTSCRAGMRAAVAVGVTAAALTIPGAAGMHGRLPWLAATSRPAMAVPRQRSNAPDDAMGPPQAAAGIDGRSLGGASVTGPGASGAASSGPTSARRGAHGGAHGGARRGAVSGQAGGRGQHGPGRASSARSLGDGLASDRGGNGRAGINPPVRAGRPANHPAAQATSEADEHRASPLRQQRLRPAAPWRAQPADEVSQPIRVTPHHGTSRPRRGQLRWRPGRSRPHPGRRRPHPGTEPTAAGTGPPGTEPAAPGTAPAAPGTSRPHPGQRGPHPASGTAPAAPGTAPAAPGTAPAAPGISGTPRASSSTDQNHLRADPSQASV